MSEHPHEIAEEGDQVAYPAVEGYHDNAEQGEGGHHEGYQETGYAQEQEQGEDVVAYPDVGQGEYDQEQYHHQEYHQEGHDYHHDYDQQGHDYNQGYDQQYEGYPETEYESRYNDSHTYLQPLVSGLHLSDMPAPIKSLARSGVVWTSLCFFFFFFHSSFLILSFLFIFRFLSSSSPFFSLPFRIFFSIVLLQNSRSPRSRV